MSTNPIPKKRIFLVPKEAAIYIGRHPSALAKWRAAKIVLPFYKDGKKVMYDKIDLDDYLDALRVEPVAYMRSGDHAA